MEAKPKGVSLVEVDSPAEIKARPLLANSGRLPFPTKDVVNSFPKEPTEARNAAPRVSPLHTRAPSDLP